MRRAHAYLAIALCAAVLVAGCGGSSSGPAPAAPSASPTNTTPRASVSPTGTPAASPSPTSSATAVPSPTATPAPTAPPTLSSFRYYEFGGDPDNLIATEDGNVWFIQQFFDEVAYLSPSGETSSFPVVPSADTNKVGLASLTTGSDGTIWTANTDDGSISNISLTGRLISNTPIGNSVEPLSIAFGSDGNLWFTQSQTPSIIGMLTQAGAYTSYAQPQNVGSIVAGPDGDLWLLSAHLGVIRLTVSGLSTFFSDPTGAIAGPLSVGSDGNIWAGTYGTASGAATIEKITPGGVFTTYDLPGYLGLNAADPTVGWVTATLYASGPDGYVYFDEAKNDGEPNIVGQLTTSGVLRQSYAVPETSQYELITSMTMATDGDLYFVDNQGDAVGGNRAIDVWVDPATIPSSNAHRTTHVAPSRLIHVRR